MGRKTLDRFDIEAESEGNAIGHMHRNGIKKAYGRRIQKQNQGFSSGNMKITNKVLNRFDISTDQKTR